MATVSMRRTSFTCLVVIVCLATVVRDVHSRGVRMNRNDPNSRHVRRGPPPPHPGRINNPPPPPPPKRDDHREAGDDLPSDVNELMYEKYLREVTRILEDDPEFKEKMKNASREDVMTGKLARELEFASHHVRSKLDEAKRREVERLRAEIGELHRLQKNGTALHEGQIKEITGHFREHEDPKELDSFSVKDLQHLIDKATSDLDAIDKRRQAEFKKEEMFQELERRRQLDQMSPEMRAQKEREHKAEKEAMKDHPRIHEPGHKENFEEIWEQEDHLDKENFNPKTFFQLHDTNGDTLWDPYEMEAMYRKEAEKIYASAEHKGLEPEHKERLVLEEMARMREHVVKEIDRDGDRLVTLREFENFVNTAEYKKDEEWKGVGEGLEFTEDDLHRYEKELEEHMAELNKRKEALKLHKEKLAANKDPKSATQPSNQGGSNQGVPSPEFYYDVDGEKIANYDHKINDYDDYNPHFQDDKRS